MMYEAMQKISKAGFTLRECNGLLDVEPYQKLSDIQRTWIEKNKASIILQLQGQRDQQVAALIETFQADVININKNPLDGRR